LKASVSVVPSAVLVSAVLVGGVRSTVDKLVRGFPVKLSGSSGSLGVGPTQLAVTVAPAGMVGAQPESNQVLVPAHPIDEHLEGIPLAKTVRLSLDPKFKPLEKTMVTSVPLLLTVPLTKAGGPCVELFVTVNVFAIAKASFPVVS
jgi:hypothetical protein